MKESINYQCPYCNHFSVIKPHEIVETEIELQKDNVEGPRGLWVYFIVCQNNSCKKYSLNCKLYSFKYGSYQSEEGEEYGHHDLKELNSWRLVPNSRAKVFPDYIPKAIIEDYNEACAIVDGSPKAAATLARRCLQGMIRDFWGIKKGTLNLEIEALKDTIDPAVWGSIDAVRKIGNIGAHMEKNIDHLIPVDPGEADTLIKLIEILITEWYVHKHEREKTLKEVIDIAKTKDTMRKSK